MLLYKGKTELVYTNIKNSSPIFVSALSARLRDTNHFRKCRKIQVKSKIQFALQWSLYSTYELLKHV